MIKQKFTAAEHAPKQVFDQYPAVGIRSGGQFGQQAIKFYLGRTAGQGCQEDLRDELSVILFRIQ